MRIFLLAFLLLPLAEIYLLMTVGGVIGAGWTIALVALTALIGAAQVRAQGFATLARARAVMARGQPPALEMLEGFMLFAAGALLLTPGFFTDAAGFALLAPPLRRRLIGRALRAGRFNAQQFSAAGARHRHSTYSAHDGGGGRGPGRVIDADYEKID